MASLLPNAKNQFLDANGRPLAGGKLYHYYPGTENKRDTFQDEALTIPNTNPILLDAYGEAIIWGYGAYRQVLTDKNDALIWDQITKDSDASLSGDMVDNVFVPGDGVAPNTFVPGTTATLTLSTAPGSKANVWAYFDGTYQQPSQISSVNGLNVTFLSPIPVGVSEVNVKVGRTVAVGVPADGSVDDDAVADGSDLYNRIHDTVSVYDYMTFAQALACRAGWADDHGAVQAAVNAILGSPNGGEVTIPDGSFELSTPLSIPITTKTLRFRGKGGSSRIRLKLGTANSTIYVGQGSSAGPGVDYLFSDFKVCSPKIGTANAFDASNANTCVWTRVSFDPSLLSAVVMHSCYATRFNECTATNLANYFVYSYTSCHNIILNKCMLYGVGGTTGSVLQIADGGATNNIVLRDCDLESCANILNIPAGCSSVEVTGCYIEYTANLEFFCRGICYGIDINNNWLALNTQNGTLPSGGGSQLLVNIQGGRLFNNTIGYMTLQFDAACRDIDEGGNVILTQPGQLGLLGPAPFTPPPAYLNAWVQGARAVGFKKQQDGTVELRGVLNGTNAGTTAFQLPGGYRPAQQLRVPIVHEGGNTVGVAIIDSNGNVVPLTLTGGTVTLDGVRFIATPQ